MAGGRCNAGVTGTSQVRAFPAASSLQLKMNVNKCPKVRVQQQPAASGLKLCLSCMAPAQGRPLFGSSEASQVSLLWRQPDPLTTQFVVFQCCPEEDASARGVVLRVLHAITQRRCASGFRKR